MKKTSIFFMVIVLCFAILGCNSPKSDTTGLWDDAFHTEDTELGEGSKTLLVRVEAEGNSILFTIHTDAKTVGEALTDNNLISGDEGAYGLYVKEVNGIIADYDVDQTYWAFNKNGKPMPTGVDQAEFTDGEEFELVRTK